ncbi:hypothetical protein ACTXT7_000632 [Hymenolepis weldensis]
MHNHSGHSELHYRNSEREEIREPIVNRSADISLDKESCRKTKSYSNQKWSLDRKLSKVEMAECEFLIRATLYYLPPPQDNCC